VDFPSHLPLGSLRGDRAVQPPVDSRDLPRLESTEKPHRQRDHATITRVCVCMYVCVRMCVRAGREAIARQGC